MSDIPRILLLGCGRSRERRVWPTQQHRQPGDTQFGQGLVTLDCDHRAKPDLWGDLNSAPPWYVYPRDPEVLYRDQDSIAVEPGKEVQQGVDLRYTKFKPYGDPPRAYQVAYELLPDYWDEIHAYEVLEHLGSQGDALALFRQFAELWRILKPGGHLCCTVPSRYSLGVWGDPSHRRHINAMTLAFLDQSEYVRQCDSAQPTPMSDYRHIYKADFICRDQHDNRENFVFDLEAIKPSRWKEPPA